MENMTALINLLKEKHGKELNLNDDVYYLFFKDGYFLIYFNEDEKDLKLEIEFLPEGNTFIYHDDTTSLEDLLGIKGD